MTTNYSEVDAGNRLDLNLIQQIDGFLREARIHYWLRGGWGLNFLPGRITWLHDDIDLVTWKRNRFAIRRHFEAHGYAEEKLLCRQTTWNFSKDGCDVSVLFVLKGPVDELYTAGFEQERPLWSRRNATCYPPASQWAGLPDDLSRSEDQREGSVTWLVGLLPTAQGHRSSCPAANPDS